MYQLSIITIIFAAIVFLILGMLLNYLISNRNKIDYKSQYEEAAAELDTAQKKLKKADGKLKQTADNRDTWQRKATALESDLGEMKSTAESTQEAMRVEIAELNKRVESLTLELERIKRDKEQLQDVHNKLKEKYSANNKESKEWSALVQRAEKDRDEYKAKAIRAIKESKELNVKLEAQVEKIERFKEVSRDLRRANAKNKKLETDVSYWEQKHFDAHHELAALKKDQAPAKEQLQNITDLRNGDKIMMENMRKKLESFQNKYNELHQKYKEYKNGKPKLFSDS